MNNKRNVCSWRKLRSKYILCKIFGTLNLRIYLKLIKHTKKLLNKLGIGLNDYKDYNKIEIIIKSVNLEHDTYYEKFININYDPSYYHIYFDGNNNEILNRYSIHASEKIKQIKIIIDKEVISFYELFDSCNAIESIEFKWFKSKNINNMCGMFAN